MKHLLLLIALSLPLYAEVWTFPNSNSPPVVEPGQFSIGWVNTLPFSTNQGFWDLGASGTITVPVPTGNVIVETVEWYDGMIYGKWATATIGGLAPVSESFEISEQWPVLGNWYAHTMRFNSPGGTLVITGAPTGTVIDRLTVTGGTVAKLTIQGASSMNGPWSNVAALTATNQNSQTFYRLQIE